MEHSDTKHKLDIMYILKNFKLCNLTDRRATTAKDTTTVCVVHTTAN